MHESIMICDHSFESYRSLNDQLQYLDHLALNYEMEQVVVDPIVAYRYQGNFFGLLYSLGVNPNMFVLTMVANGLHSPYDFNGSIGLLKLPIKPPIPSH